jgi:hypothetical protein
MLALASRSGWESTDTMSTACFPTAKAVKSPYQSGRNPFAIYLYTEKVDELASSFGCKAEDKPWVTYEFGVSDPDETLVRVGWPTRLRGKR